MVMSGIFGVVSKSDCLDDLFYGTDYHSHLGTEFGGIAVFDKGLTRQIHNISHTQFKSRFYDDLDKMKGNKGIGVISDCDEQPIYLKSPLGQFSIVSTGFIDNAAELSARLLKEGHSFSEYRRGQVNHTELVAKLISKGENITDGIEQMFRVIKGSCSLVILTEKGLIAARDRYGYTPLVLGKKEASYAVTTETSAFVNLDFNIEKFLEPGEIVFIDEDGVQLRKEGAKTAQVCSFLWIYTGFPASDYEGINVEKVRERSGKLLAKRDKDIDVDIVSGVPDSGLAHAVGYAAESKVTYRRPLVKYTPGYGRSYTPPEQEKRDLIARMKLVPIKEIIRGNRIILCEDSIVRGTQLKNYTVKKLWDAGAKEVHVRAACPPLMFPCKYNLSTRSLNELVARKAIKSLETKETEDVSEYLDHKSQKYKDMIEFIRKELGVTTLRYQTIDDMIKAIGLPKERLCLECWKGAKAKSCCCSGECLGSKED